MLTGLVLAACAVDLTAAAAYGEYRPTAVIPQGTIKGFRDEHSNSVFLGVPFAATTGGENRWKAPQDLPGSRSVFDAKAYGPTCPQAISNSAFTQQDEDCLNLNIWAPSKGRNLPVFVYMYGGAMVTGSNSNPQIQGSNFARKGVVYVNFNTRESIFASPNSAELKDGYESQNFSILDVEKALEWIRKNIRAFGGNPDHIVFGGHSSGAVQVDHYLWNHPDTFLKGAVEMSANAMSGPGYAPTNEALNAVAEEVGCPKGKGQLDCLREVDVYAFQTANFNSTFNTWFTPVIDEITRHSNYAARFSRGQYASHVPMLTGTSDGEGTIFSLVYGAENSDFSSWINTFDADVAHIPDKLLLNAYKSSDYESEALRSGAQYGDARFNCPVDYLLDLRSRQQNTWVYRFFGAYDNVVGPPNTAPTHGTEVPFFHGGNECFDSLSGVTEAQQALADSIHNWFVAWIKNPSAGPGWNKVSGLSGEIVKLGVPGNELARLNASRQQYNGVCQAVYNPAFSRYPVVQSVEDLVKNLLGSLLSGWILRVGESCLIPPPASSGAATDEPRDVTSRNESRCGCESYVVVGFVATAWVVVISVAATYCLSWDSGRGDDEDGTLNMVDYVVLGSTRRFGRTLLRYMDYLIPTTLSPFLGILLDQKRIRRVFNASLLALSDLQIFTGLTIIISGFVSLCPSENEPNGIPAYHWQVLVHLAWFSAITHQGALIFMQHHFQRHPWQRNTRLVLMGALLIMLLIAMVPTAFFNWYSKRYRITIQGTEDDETQARKLLLTYFSLARSAAQPVSPALCYFNLTTASTLFNSSQECQRGDLTIPLSNLASNESSPGPRDTGSISDIYSKCHFV
ncbi:acetylcholinesterase precursor, partial [Fusarium albosuccineum]